MASSATPLQDRRNGIEMSRLYSTAKHTLALPKLDGETFTLSGYVYDTILQTADIFEAPARETQESTTEMMESPTLSPFWSFMCRLMKAMACAAIATAQGDGIALAEAELTKEDPHDVYWQTLTCINKSDVSGSTGGHDATSRQREFREMHNAWYSPHRCSRLSFRLELSKLSILVPLLCIGIDILLLHLNATQFRRIALLFLYTQAGGRRVARTGKGHLALVASEAPVGDSIGVSKGGKVPLIIRPVGVNSWELLGDAYVHGIMKGEA